jgi:hypothetical protein
VLESVAHSWPEVYFPGFGWERFEPTPASYTNLPQRPLTSEFGEDSGDMGGAYVPDQLGPERFEELDEGLIQGPANASPIEGGPLPAGWARSLAFVGSVLALLLLAAGAIYGRWRLETRGLSPAAAAYAGMALLASWGGIGQEPHRTPLEYGERLGAALPEQRGTIRQIVGAYAAERYSPGRSSAELPSPEEQAELRSALVRNIFASIGARLPQPRER